MESDDEPEDDGPLRLVRFAVPWKAFLSDLAIVNVVYPHSSGGGTLSEVVVSDGWDVVAVTLFRRATIGTYPDGSVSVELLDLKYSCVAVVLDGALGDRKIIDGSTGEPGEPFTADDELWQSLTTQDGCPMWVP